MFENMDIDGMIKRLEKQLADIETEHQKAISQPGYTENLEKNVKDRINQYLLDVPYLKGKNQRQLAKYRLWTDLNDYEKLLREVKSSFDISAYIKTQLLKQEQILL